MNLHTLATIVIAVLVIGFVTVRQTRWQPVRVGRLLRMPVIFAVVGVISLSSATKQLPGGWHLQFSDIALIGVELVVGLVAGWLMGRWTELRTVDGVVRSRLVGVGIGVWLGFIALRIGTGVVAHLAGAAIAELPGTIFVVLAVVKAVQALIIRERVDRHQAAEANQLADPVSAR